ncbi:hypothetical protein N7474_007971, partial [Penicillium riverlandense]|uniref:uncharacterized protein n=1 Tax=Penicillium riverlandense TaxID=1903569 RepID=UPI002547ABB0
GQRKAASEMTGQVKRPASPATSSANKCRRQIRRAGIACRNCRGRKVRCDVEHGSPCTNCRLDKADCIIADRRRRFVKFRPFEKQYRFPSRQLSYPQNDSAEAMRNASHASGCGRGESVASVNSPNLTPAAQSNASTDREVGNYATHPAEKAGWFLEQATSEVRKLLGSRIVPTEPSVTSEYLPSPQQTQNSRSKSSDLPCYIKSPSAHLEESDMQYLAIKGALEIPEPPVRDRLLESYAVYVHSFSPIVNLDEILQIIHGIYRRKRVSLPLFQAIMFSGAASVDMEVLSSAGFSSRICARRALFQRVKLLYEMDFETDCRISIIQSLLLMTFCRETDGAQKDSWYWMGACLTHAMSIGLHRDCSASRHLPRDWRFRRRLWWSIYVRDRLMALELNCPTRIRDDECDISPLTLVDFEIDAEPSEASKFHEKPRALHDRGSRRTTAVICIEITKLCGLISGILSTLTYNCAQGTHPAEQIMPDESSAKESQVQFYDNELRDWLNTVPADAQYSSFPSTRVSDASRNLHLHSGFLKVIYLFLILTLHDPRAFQNEIWMPNSDFCSTPKRQVSFAAKEITGIMWSLYNASLTRYLPTSGLAILYHVARTHFLGMRSDNPRVRMESLRQFRQCVHVLQSLRETHAPAEPALLSLQQCTRKEDIDLMVNTAEAHGVDASTTGTLVQSPVSMTESVQTLYSSQAGDPLDSALPGSKTDFSEPQPFSEFPDLPVMRNESLLDHCFPNQLWTAEYDEMLQGCCKDNKVSMLATSRSSIHSEKDTRMFEAEGDVFVGDYLELDDTLIIY